MTKALPSYDELVDYNQAVAGHDGILSDVSGELFIKPCTQNEITFYETSVALYPEFMKILPTYMGALSLDEKTDEFVDKSVNSSLPAKKENHDNEKETKAPSTAIASSKTSMQNVAEPSISKELNMKAAGHRIITNQALVLENASFNFKQPNILDVKLGVRLWANDAPEAKRIRFDKITAESTHKELGFRISGMRVWHGLNSKGSDIDDKGYKIFDKYYGRVSINCDNVHEAFKTYLISGCAGVDEKLRKYILNAFLEDLIVIQTQLENHENRMYSASLLFVYEGDEEALRAAIQNNGYSNEATDESESSEQGNAARTHSVKLIDFAHAEWTPGQGPDENTLVGVRSVVKIFKDLSLV